MVLGHADKNNVLRMTNERDPANTAVSDIHQCKQKRTIDLSVLPLVLAYFMSVL